MEYEIKKCPICGKNAEMPRSNNPIAQPVCFECIKKILKYNDIADADFFCRTYNIPLDPELWIKIADALESGVFKEYMTLQYNEDFVKEYAGKTQDVWEIVNREWRRMTKQAYILEKIKPMKDAYILREGITWGHQYSFEELIELDSLYIQSIQANRITNPLQKKSLKTLLKVMVDMDKAILNHDSAELKNLSATYKILSATAQLDDMIEDTHTDDITTIAEVALTLEEAGFEMPYYDGAKRDEIDVAIANIQESNVRTIKAATGLSQLIEQISEKQKNKKEQEKTKEAIEKTSIDELLIEYTDQSIEEDSDAAITDIFFEDEKDE